MNNRKIAIAIQPQEDDKLISAIKTKFGSCYVAKAAGGFFFNDLEDNIEVVKTKNGTYSLALMYPDKRQFKNVDDLVNEILGENEGDFLNN